MDMDPSARFVQSFVYFLNIRIKEYNESWDIWSVEAIIN